MERIPAAPHKSNKPSWVIGAIILLCAVLAMCLVFIVSGVLYLRPIWGQQTNTAGSPAAATELVEPPSLTEPPASQGRATLDYQAAPIYGSVDLLRAFTPDPHVVDVRAGGSVDASDLDPSCGLVTANPTFRFTLKGGASETFLRIYFIAASHVETTLVVHSPDGQWLCVDGGSAQSGIAPVVDFEFGPSGQYAIWAGTMEEGQQIDGSLYITQSQENHP